MSKSYISVELRKRVEQRAQGVCEYCLVPLLYGFYTPYHIDHIISEKQGGETTFENLAFACKTCNTLKGSNIAAFLKEERITVRLYNPRFDDWTDHFALNDAGVLLAKTDIAKGTIKLLDLNEPSYAKLRSILIKGNIQLVGPFEADR